MNGDIFNKTFKFHLNHRNLGFYRPLGHRESQIMNVIWNSGQVTVAQVHETLSMDNKVAYTTIMTIMGRLEKKGLLQRKVFKKAYIYSALVTKEAFSVSIIQALLGGLISELSRPALSFFMDNLSKEDEAALDELAKLIQARKLDGEN